jgi:hypothetical protein
MITDDEAVAALTVFAEYTLQTAQRFGVVLNREVVILTVRNAVNQVVREAIKKEN